MQNVHPIFQTALRGIAPPADAKRTGKRYCIRLRTELTQYDAMVPQRGNSNVYRHPELGTL